MATDLIVEIELSGQGNGWTNITADVLRRYGVSGYRGVSGAGPTDRVAGTGTFQFTLNNDVTNSGSTLGWYSTENTFSRAGWQSGIGVRCRHTINGTDWELWTGTIQTIEPTTGPKGERAVSVSCVDYIDKLARHKLTSMTMKTNRAEATMFQDLLDAMGIQPRSIESTTGPDTFAYGFDLTRDESTRPLREMQRLASSTLAMIYMRADGTIVYEPRTVRTDYLDTPDIYLGPQDFRYSKSPQVSDNRPHVINRVQTEIAPRDVDTGSVVLAQKPAVTRWPAGDTVTVRVPFTDPGQRAMRSGGITMAAGAFTFNEAEDGTGTDRTSDISVVTTFTSNSAIFTVTNPLPTDVYDDTPLFANGLGVRAYGRTLGEDEDQDLIDVHGENAVKIEMPYQDEPKVAQEVAEYILYVHKQDIYQVPSVTLFCDNVGNPTRAQEYIQRDISHRVAVTESLSGLDAAEFFINGIGFEVDEAGLWLTWNLIIADRHAYWLLEIPGSSELDQTTCLGFGYVVGHTDSAHSDAHTDTAHSDTAHVDTHTDVAHGDDAHGDSAHTDTHSDSAHNDTHSDSAHGDVSHVDTAHVDSHSDVAHVDGAHGDTAHDDSHTDVPAVHADIHNDSHTDSHTDTHTDTPYTDVHQDDVVEFVHFDSHNDQAHGDTHSDTHSDVLHQDTHTDTTQTHTDSHTDVPHSDSHSDTAHSDTHSDTAHSDTAHTDDAHADVHVDDAHGDTHDDAGHADTGHVDTAHTDSHSDTSHADTAHEDTHGDVAHGDAN